MKYFTLLIIVSSLVFGLSACTSIDELKSTKVYTPKLQRDGKVNVASRATGIDGNKVGKTTLMTLPIASIKARGDTSANIMASVRDALAAAGYNADDASYSSEDAAYLNVHVSRIEFGNFLFSTWGTVILNLRLETREGELLWRKRLRTDINAINNYDRTAIFTMNRVVKAMTLAFIEEDFYLATQRVKRHNDFLKENTPLSPESEQ